MSGWTIDTLKEHLDALRDADQRATAEGNRLRAEAIKIKETADAQALQLAREIQTYKDEKANELRSQIERERGSYATQGDLKAVVEKIEATIGPLLAFVAVQQGQSTSRTESRAGSQWAVGLAVSIVVAAVSIAGLVAVLVAN